MTPLHRAVVLLAVWLGGFAHLVAGEAVVTRTDDGGQQITRDGVRLLSVIGDGATMGRQAGTLLAPQTQAMLTTMRALSHAGDTTQLAAVLPADYRAEIAAWATAATCDPTALLSANLAVDALCTAVVRLGDAATNRPLLIARNMDFAPAQVLGPTTVVIARRPTGCRASLSLGWPGYAGIVSGMNDAGVSAFLLLNLSPAAKRKQAGESLGFRLRAILDHAGTLDEAVRLFAATPIASTNYVLLADDTSASVVWWQDGAMQRSDPVDGWLYCTNAHIDPASRIPQDARGKHAHDLTRLRPNPDVDWMKHLLTATYMPATVMPMNAQAMVLVPATRTVHLATFGARAAALSSWHQLDGAQLMAGADLATVPLITTPAISDPFPHYAKAH